MVPELCNAPEDSLVTLGGCQRLLRIIRPMSFIATTALHREQPGQLLPPPHAFHQARQRKKLFLQGQPVYPLATHYCQTWQHLPDYGAYYAH